MLFRQPEWSNFLKAESRRPLRFLFYSVVLIRLIIRRSVNFVSLNFLRFSDPHRGLKIWPAWLPRRSFCFSKEHSQNLRFPCYKFSSSDNSFQEDYSQIYKDDDEEARFASNRWQDCFFAALASEDIANKVLHSTINWIKTPPPLEDPAWETYSVCERVVNLAVMLSRFQTLWESLSLDDKKLIIGFFQKSACWIHEHLEYYGISLTNNHILNNARALIVVGSILEDDLILEQGFLVFTRMSKELFQPSGSLRERSMHYQLVAANWIMDMVAFSQSYSRDNLSIVNSRNELLNLSRKVLKVSKLLHLANQKLDSYVGDISPDHHPLQSVKRLASLYPENWGEKVELFGFQRHDDWVVLEHENNMLLTCTISGVYPTLYATHGHDDYASILWAVGDLSILVDSGRCDYRPKDVGLLQSGAHGHNVITISGLSALAGSLLLSGRWFPTPYSSISTSIEGLTDRITIIHNGFARIPGVGSHKRTASLGNGELVVLDEVFGEGRLPLEMFWHFAPGWVPFDKSNLSMFNKSHRLAISVNWTSGRYEKSWQEFPFSRFYGDQKSCYMLTLRGEASLPLAITTRIRIY